MNKTLLVCGFVLGAAPALAAKQITATKSFENKTAYIALKNVQGGHVEATALLQIEGSTLKSSNIRLDKEMSGREIIGIVPSKKDILVITQLTNESGDEPSVFIYNLKKRKWHKGGTVSCQSPKSIAAQKNLLVFECAPPTTKNTKADAKEYLAKLELSSLSDVTPFRFALPQEDLNLSGVSISPTKEGATVTELKFKSSRRSLDLKLEDVSF